MRSSDLRLSTLFSDHPWIGVMLGALAVILITALVHRIGTAVLLRVTRPMPVLHHVALAIRRPARLVLPLFGLQLLWQASGDSLPAIDSVRHVNGVLFIAAVTWLLMSAVSGVADGVLSRHSLDVADNLHARRVQTQAQVLARTLMGLILVIGVSVALMTFPGVRQVGASLLASAGVAGLVAGIAARPVLGNLIAGLQIALAQPIRIDDVLVVEGEWGRVEEITGTYVVLRIWDLRRLIVPLQWFIEHPFQNWTRSSSTVIGSVFVWVDYGMPIEPLRAEARRICEASPEWDGELCKLQVVETSERAIQLRCIVTTPDSGRGWDLRCKLREGLVDFVQREYPQFLPRLRTDVDRVDMARRGDSPEPPLKPVAPPAAAPDRNAGADSAGTSADPTADASRR
jgi:small-conductance mechanosensitive channel